MTAYEERQIIMELAGTLQNIVGQINESIARLVGQGDSLLIKAADSSPESEGKKIKAVTYERDDRSVVQAQTVAPKLAKGKRACSLCRQPGHRAQNCPNAHTVRAEKMQAAEQPKQRQKRKPMSPERKAQLAKALEKARAARKKR